MYTVIGKIGSEIRLDCCRYIPIAFSGEKGKNNLYANVRSVDLPIFKQMLWMIYRNRFRKH